MIPRVAPWILGVSFLLSSATGRAQMFNVTFLHTPPAKTVAGRLMTLSGNIIGADQVSIAALAYRVEGQGDFEVRELKLISGDLYEGTIPGPRVKPPAIEYYCYAVDFEGNRHTVFASEQEPQRVEVVSVEAVDSGGPAKRKDPPAGDGTKATRVAKSKDQKKSAAPNESEASQALPATEVTLHLASHRPEQLDRAAAMASVVDRAQIEGMGARTVADVLDQIPGISVSRSVSGEYRLAMRGVKSDPEILVMLDGHRINDLYSGAALLEFPAEAVDRVEVIRGPAAALWGTGAFMGVINILSRQEAGVHASAAYGLFNEVRVSAGGGYQGKKVDFGGQVQFIRTDGQDRKVKQDVLTGVEGTARTDDMSNTPGSVDDSRMQVHAQLQAAIKDLGGGELKLLGHYVFQSRGAFVGKLDSLDLGSDLSLHLINTDLTYAVPVSDKVRLDARAYFDTHMVDRAFQVIRAPENEFGNAYDAGGVILTEGMRESDTYSTMTTGVELDLAAQLLKKNLLMAGLQFEYLSLSAFTQKRDVGDVTGNSCTTSDDGCVTIQGFELPIGTHKAEPSGKDRILFGFFLQDQWSDILPGLDLLATFRLDYFTDFGLTFNPRVAVVYSPVEGLRIKALYAQAFRAPTFQELYDDPLFDPLRSFQGNDKLDPVKINTLEFGLEGHVPTRWVEYRLRGNFFYNWITDSVESLDQGTGLPTYANVESLEVYGTEVEAVARIGERSRLFVNSSWFRAEAKAAGRNDASYITDVPQMRFNLGMDLAVFDWLNGHLGVRYGSERRNNIRQQMELLRSFRIPAYTLVRVGLSTEPILFDHLVLFAHAYNVFDLDVRDPPPRPDHLVGYLPRAPFSFLAGIAWRP